MSAWLAGAYPWIKSAHVVSIVAWMAGLLYLPRLFVYHAAVPVESRRSATFKIMERRLQNAIMTDKKLWPAKTQRELQPILQKYL